MVDPSLIRTSNNHLPTHLTAVFVGATSGIGLYTLQSFAKHCTHPTAYFIGRSQPAATKILTDLNKLNPNGKYHFIQSDVSLIKNVDKVCEEIRGKEKRINMLVLSQGTMVTGQSTEEGLHAIASLIAHSRMRFALNLLPLLQSAPTLRRVVSIFAGTKDGPFVTDDLQMWNLKNPMKAREQAASVVTLLLEEAAKRAPDVSFVHDFPGPVRSNIARDGGVANFIVRGLFKLIGPFVYIPEEESGERHLFLATSARYPAKSGGADGVEVEKGVEVKKGVEVAKGTDGGVGSGVYAVDEKCEEGGEQLVQMWGQLRKQGKDAFTWKTVRDDYMRITGKECL